jgi:hypothetical protein
MKVLIFLDTINKESLFKDSMSSKPLCHKNRKTKKLMVPFKKEGGEKMHCFKLKPWLL